MPHHFTVTDGEHEAAMLMTHAESRISTCGHIVQDLWQTVPLL